VLTGNPEAEAALQRHRQADSPNSNAGKNLAERGIVGPVVESEARVRRALVCLLFSTRFLDFLQSLDSMGDKTLSNKPKLVASRVKTQMLQAAQNQLPSARARQTLHPLNSAVR